MTDTDHRLPHCLRCGEETEYAFSYTRYVVDVITTHYVLCNRCGVKLARKIDDICEQAFRRLEKKNPADR